MPLILKNHNNNIVILVAICAHSPLDSEELLVMEALGNSIMMDSEIEMSSQELEPNLGASTSLSCDVQANLDASWISGS